MTTIHDITDKLSEDKPLQNACKRTYIAILHSTKPKYESQLAEELLSPELLGRNTNLHGSYLRSALDILVSGKLIKKKDAKYSN